MKSEAPTPLETDLDIESDLVTVPRAPSAPRRCALQRLKPWLPQTTTSLISAASKAFSLRKSRSCLRAATTAGGVEARRVFRACRAISQKIAPLVPPYHRQRVAVGGSESSRCSSALRILNRGPGDPSFESCTARRWSSLCRTLVRQLVATTAGGVVVRRVCGISRTVH